MSAIEINLFPIIAASLNANSSLADKVVFQITGFIIVLTVLASLWAAISILGAFFSRFHFDIAPEPSQQPLPKTPQTPPLKAELSPQHVAAIAGALHTVMKGPYRIVNIKELPEEKK